MCNQHVAVAASWAVRTLGVCRPLPATGLATAATLSQIGHYMAGEQQARSVRWKAFCPRAAQSYSRWELGLDGTCVHVDQQSSPMSPAAGPRGASVPCCAS